MTLSFKVIRLLQAVLRAIFVQLHSTDIVRLAVTLR